MAYQRQGTGLLLCIALVTAGLFYLLQSQRGIAHYTQHIEQQALLRQQVAAQEAQVQELEAKIAAWQSDSLEQERFFRYELSMGYTNEVVYLVPKSATGAHSVG